MCIDAKPRSSWCAFQNASCWPPCAAQNVSSISRISSLPGSTVVPNWSSRATESRAASVLLGAFSRRLMVACEANGAPVSGQRPTATFMSGSCRSRLARSIGDLQDIVRQVRSRGASLKATEQPIDTSTAAGKCFLDMLGVFAEFETNLRRERQLEGIAKAKAEGVYTGRPTSIDVATVREMKAQGIGGHGDCQS